MRPWVVLERKMLRAKREDGDVHTDGRCEIPAPGAPRSERSAFSGDAECLLPTIRPRRYGWRRLVVATSQRRRGTWESMSPRRVIGSAEPALLSRIFRRSVLQKNRNCFSFDVTTPCSEWNARS